ncbi:MAG: hypothetical protein AB4057_03100, partial [Crocosphaera sp.]
SEITEVSIVEDHDIPLTQDWFNLARKLRGQNRQLLDTIVTLEQALSASRQELQDYQERSRHHNSLFSQQTDQLQTIQAENSHLREQLQTAQTKLQKEQSHLESLSQQTDQLQTIQTENSHLREQLQASQTQLKQQQVDLESLSQQKNQLQTIQTENSHLREELKASQTKLQQQQSDLESLQKQLQSNQEAFTDLERESILLKQETLQSKHQLVLKEEEIREIQQRLQRQQRYSLQYKSALDQCLSRHSKKTNASQGKESTTVDEKTAPNIISIQPWSSSLKEKTPIPPSGEVAPSDRLSIPIEETLEELFSLNPDPDCNPTDIPSLSETEDHFEQGTAITSQAIVVSSRDPFSFSIDPDRKEDAAREKVDLPSFLRRQ